MALSDVIGRLAEVNEEQLLETQNIKIEIESLSDRFASFIRIAEGEQLDKLEDRREERKKSKEKGFAGKAKEAAKQAKGSGLTLIDLLVKGAGLAVAAGVIIPLILQNEELSSALGELGTIFGESAGKVLEGIFSVFTGKLGRDLNLASKTGEQKEKLSSLVLGDRTQQNVAQAILGKGEFGGLVPVQKPEEELTANDIKQNKQFIIDVLKGSVEGEEFLKTQEFFSGFTPITSPETQAARLLFSQSSGPFKELTVGEVDDVIRIAEEGGTRLLPAWEALNAVGTVYNQVEQIIDAQAGKPVGMDAPSADIPIPVVEEFTQQFQGLVPEIPRGAIRGEVEPAPIPGAGLIKRFFDQDKEESSSVRVLTPEERISLSGMGASATTNAVQIKGSATEAGVGGAGGTVNIFNSNVSGGGSGGMGGPVPGKHGISYTSGESKFTPFFRMSAISGSLDIGLY